TVPSLLRSRLFYTICLLGFASALGSARPVALSADQSPPECDVNRLPSAIVDLIKAEHSSWMIQRPSNLTPSGRRGWEYKKYWKPNECPGIAVGSFEESRPSYAILLVQSDQSD